MRVLQQLDLTVDGQDIICVYSDIGCYVMRDGEAHTEICDRADIDHNYTEGDYMTQDDLLSHRAFLRELLKFSNENIPLEDFPEEENDE